MYNSGKYLVVLFLFIICFNKQIKAGDTLTSANVESISLQLFTEKNWKELVPFSENAINKGFDYYYLRMRAGIGCYETKKYRKAEGHLRKALNFNSGDEEATNYLYLCLVFNQKYEEAKWISKSFTEEQKDKLQIKKPFPITYLSVEGGVKTSSVSDTFSNGQYYQLGLEHFLFHRVSFFHSFNYYGQDQTNYLLRTDSMPLHKWHQPPPVPGSPDHLDSSTVFTNSIKKVTSIQQYHYYLKANIPFKNNFLLSLSGQWILEKDKVHVNNYSISGTDPEHEDQPQHNVPMHTVSKEFPGHDTIFSLSSYIVYTTIKKYTTFLDYSIGALVNSMGKDVEYQFAAGIEYHPLANNRFVLGCIGYTHSRNGLSENVIAYSPYVSFVPIKKLTFTADFMQNQAGNVVEYSGFYVNNSKYYIKNRFGATVKYQLFKKVNVYGNYGLENKGDRDNSNFNFTNNLFLLGIAITP